MARCPTCNQDDLLIDDTKRFPYYCPSCGSVFGKNEVITINQYKKVLAGIDIEWSSS